MDDLLREFLTETAESLSKLDAEILKLEQNPNNPELLGSIFRLVHTVKGTCGFIGLTPPKGAQGISVVVEQGKELYSLAVDQIGEVMSLPAFDYEKNPATLDPRWQDVSAGIYRLKNSLLVILDAARLLRVPQDRAA